MHSIGQVPEFPVPEGDTVCLQGQAFNELVKGERAKFFWIGAGLTAATGIFALVSWHMLVDK